MNIIFSANEDRKMCNRHMKRCLSSFIIREIHVKVAVRYHFIQRKLVHIKRKKKTQTTKTENKQ